MKEFESELASRIGYPGVVTGLAWIGPGSGGILFIEATRYPGSQKLILTGKLGEVIKVVQNYNKLSNYDLLTLTLTLKESANIALSWVRALSTDDMLKNTDVHIHVPAGAVAKDGPSAGIAIVAALLSLFSMPQARLVPPTTAMTGEITLRGRVLAVGGIKEKLIAAHRAGVTKVIIPAQNAKDLAQVPASVRSDVEIVTVETISDALVEAFGRDNVPSIAHDTRRHFSSHL